ncbi:hypothetical protein GCM10020254_18830 [Streptomyces goshikiensis]
MRFLWSGDLAGQGWGINPEIGGYRVFEEMRLRDPDFFLFSGDTIYADGPIQAAVPLRDGTVWHNITTEEKAKVAETLTEFRGNFRYNLLDRNLRDFNAQVPVLAQWDDHEVRNNWYPGQVIDDPRYTVKDADTLAARARQAFGEYFPVTDLRGGRTEGRMYRVMRHGPLLDVFVLDMRTYRDPNSPGRQTDDPVGILGTEQLGWLKRELSRSRATWKVIAADMPLGIVVPDGAANFEAVAQGDPGAPLGRELQIAELLRHIKHQRITGTLWLTADVHYTAANHYAPERAAFTDFAPFWEFVSGPIGAGGFPAGRLDATFGPETAYVQSAPVANMSPAENPRTTARWRSTRPAGTSPYGCAVRAAACSSPRPCGPGGWASRPKSAGRPGSRAAGRQGGRAAGRQGGPPRAHRPAGVREYGHRPESRAKSTRWTLNPAVTDRS